MPNAFPKFLKFLATEYMVIRIYDGIPLHALSSEASMSEVLISRQVDRFRNALYEFRCPFSFFEKRNHLRYSRLMPVFIARTKTNEPPPTLAPRSLRLVCTTVRRDADADPAPEEEPGRRGRGERGEQRGQVAGLRVGSSKLRLEYY